MEEVKISHVIYGGKKYHNGFIGVAAMHGKPHLKLPFYVSDDEAVLGDCAVVGNLAVMLACVPEWDKTTREVCVLFAGEELTRRAEAMVPHLQVVYQDNQK